MMTKKLYKELFNEIADLMAEDIQEGRYESLFKGWAGIYGYEAIMEEHYDEEDYEIPYDEALKEAEVELEGILCGVDLALIAYQLYMFDEEYTFTLMEDIPAELVDGCAEECKFGMFDINGMTKKHWTANKARAINHYMFKDGLHSVKLVIQHIIDKCVERY